MAISKNQIKFIRQLEQKKFRRREGLFVAEGTKVVGDLLAHYQPHSLFATQEWLAQHSSHLTLLTSHLYPVTDDELRRLSFLRHPQQVLALFPIPLPPNISLTSHPSPLTSELSLALDGIQDPGNLGTIIRIADWFGITDFPVYGTLLDGENIYTHPLTPYGLIVMGNEGNGISPEIRQRVNHRLLIPSYRQDDTAESLNVAIATAITCSEFRRR